MKKQTSPKQVTPVSTGKPKNAPKIAEAKKFKTTPKTVPEYEKNKLNTGVKFFDNYINGVRKRSEEPGNIFPFKKGGLVKSKMKTGGAIKTKKK
jgi:hypothetical protein